MLKRILKTMAVLVIVVVASTMAVFGVRQLTEPVIQARTDKEAAAAILEIVEGSDGAKNVSKKYKGYQDAGITGIYDITKSGSHVAYGININATGYHDNLNYALAFDNDGKVLGIKIVSHGETSNIGGAMLNNKEFLEQFKSLTLDSKGTDIDIGTAPTEPAYTLKGIRNSFSKAAKFCNDKILKNGGSGEYTPVDNDATLISMYASASSSKDITGNYLDAAENAEIAYVHEMYDDSDNLLGYGFKITTSGFEEDLNYFLVFDKDGTCLKYKIGVHHESGEYGALVVEDPKFAAKYVGLTINSSSSAINDVDLDSGATATQTVPAMQQSFTRVCNFFKANLLGGAA